MSLLETVLNYLQNYITTLATAPDKTQLWFILFILFLVIYFITIWFTDVSKSTAIFIAFIPVLFLDFSFSFGKYIFSFPFGYNFTTERFVVTLQLFDFIFNFGIFKELGISTFNGITGTYILSGIQNILVFLIVFADNIIEFLLLLYIAYYIIDDFGYAFIFAAIPSIAYTYLTDPMKEYTTAQNTVQHFLYFMEHATSEQFMIVVGSALISFIIIVLLISTVSNLFISVGKSTVRPGLEASTWNLDFTGVAFGLAVIYSIAILLHPNYSWYVILPVLIGYSAFRSSMQSYASGRRERKQQYETMREAVSSVYDDRRRG